MNDYFGLVDAFNSFLISKCEYNLVMPSLTIQTYSRSLSIKSASNPLITHGKHEPKPFKSLDYDFGSKHGVQLVIGSKDSGKSIYLKTLGMIAYLAQIGCPVPVEKATLPIFDKILTRCESSADESNLRSLFYLNFYSHEGIFKDSNSNSLVLLD